MTRYDANIAIFDTMRYIVPTLILTTLFLLVLYLAYIAHNAMAKKISTKCNVFLQLIILRPNPYFTSHVRKQIRKTIRILHV